MMWFDEPGALTLCGARLVKFVRGNVWVLPPMENRPARIAPADAHAGDTEVTNLRNALSLLPDISDIATQALLRALLARRIGLDPSRGSTWTPRADGKNHAGWAIATPTQTRIFPATCVPDRDPDVALFRAIAVTNCTCQTGGGSKGQCPQHGERAYRPWR